MMRFTVKDGDVFGYTENQDDLLEHRLKEQGHTEVTKEQALEVIAKAKGHDKPKVVADKMLHRLGVNYQDKMALIAKEYLPIERESWPIQIEEATKLLKEGESAVTTWIDRCAAQRDLDRLELARRIAANDLAYRQISGFYTGVLHRHQDTIKEFLLLDDSEAMQALQAYDIEQGWELELS